MVNKQDSLRYHSEGRPGKIEVVATKQLGTQRDLSMAYTPGVADACLAIAEDYDKVFDYTAKGNLVAVVTNGTAVLGLGNIGPEAGKPVMEGKANLFKKFADIDVFDIELNAQTADEIVAAVRAIAPTFGGINLEDIKSPECFEVERRLQAELDIPVFHDDQHGTAIISGAALLNGAELTGRSLSEMRIIFSGAGAAAVACARLYVSLGVPAKNIIMFNSKGAVTETTHGRDPELKQFATSETLGSIAEALNGADCFVGLSVGNILTGPMLKGMKPNPLIFAMANPTPEIAPEEARASRPDAIIATGRSDYPNQVNNVLGFPFVFRGALDCRARKITEEMKMAATTALAELARQDVPDEVLRAYGLSELAFGPDYIIPKPFDWRVLLWVAPAVVEAAADSGVARNPIADLLGYRERLHRLVERSRGLMRPLIHRAKASPKQRIVFPEGTNAQVLRAAQILADESICTPVLLGPEWKILKQAESLRLELKGVEIQEVRSNPDFDAISDQLWERRQRKGVTRATARAMTRDPIYFATMLVASGKADGLVGGIHRAYNLTLRPALQLLGVDGEGQSVSGVYAMIFKDRKLFLGDCTVNINPTAEELANIAINTAKVAETFGQKPSVAMLSYSDFGEHRKHPEVQTVHRAIEIVRRRCPDLDIDGEMQADTAVNWDKLSDAYSFSTLTRAPNVLIFPNVSSANIAYKLLGSLAEGESLGPLLAGIARPVNVIPIHASVSQIVNTATYTVNQALDRQRS
jgi:malate dehydrogenase (oxaloacetate-decarboxylating)(NADP+)